MMVRYFFLLAIVFFTTQICRALEIPADLDESKYELPEADPSIPVWAGQRADEPFPVKEFLESRMPPEKNAAPHYLYAFSRFAPEFEYLLPETEHEAYQRKVKRFKDLTNELFDVTWLKENATSQRVEDYLNEARPYLELIDQAQKRPECVFVTGLDLAAPLPHAQYSRLVARMCQIEIANVCAKADFAAARHSIQRVLRLSRDIRSRGCMIVQLVSCAMDAVTIGAIFDFYLPPVHGASAKDLDELLIILRQHHACPINMSLEGTRIDSIILGNTFEDLRTGRNSGKEFEIEKPVLNRVDFDLERETINQIFGKLLSFCDQPNSSGQSRGFLETTMQLLQQSVEQEMSPVVSALSCLLGRKLRAPVLTVLLFPAVSQFYEATCRQQARLNGVILFAAVRRYELQHGTVPPVLAIAEKDAGFQEPFIDPYDGKQMKYALIDGQPVVYSIGSDLHDDGGQQDWKFGEQPGDFLFPHSVSTFWE